MAFAISAPRSAWRALLWKDFQQVKPAVLVVTLLLMGIQILSLLISLWLSASGTQDPFPLALPIGVATVAPFICILASMGMLIGQERQTGSWAWSNSLPQSWRQALASKMVVSLSACVLPLIPLSLIPLIAWTAGYQLMYFTSILPMIMLAVSISIDMAVFWAIGVLVFREPLTGLIVGSIVGAFGQLLSFNWSNALLRRWWGTSYNADSIFQTASLILFSQFSVVFVITCAVMIGLFRWRWRYGMASVLPRFSFPLPTSWSGGGIREAGQGFYQRAPTSEFRMLLTHSFSATWGWALLCLGLNSLMVLPWFRPTNIYTPHPFAVVVTAALWGIATFASDQSVSSFRFWADRGVSPIKLITSKILLAVLPLGAFVLLGILVLMGSLHPSLALPVSFFSNRLGVSVANPSLMLSMTALAALTSYFLGAFSSLCFRSSIMAVAVCLLSICCIALLYITVISAGSFPTDIYPDWFYLSALWMTPMAVSVGFVALYWLARKWTVQDSPRLDRHYAWIFPSLASLPALFPIAFGFLLLPNVPWQGNEHAPLLIQSSPKAWPELPQLELLELQPESRTPYGLILQPDRPTFEQNNLERVIRDFAAEQKKAWEKPLGPNKFADELEQLRRSSSQTSLDGESPFNVARKERYYDTIYATALMGNFLAKQGQVELAKLAWAVNRRLLFTASQLEPDAVDLRASIFSWLVMKDMLASMDDDQRNTFGSDEHSRDELDLVRTKTIQALRNNASYLRQQLRTPLSDRGAGRSYPWVIRAIPTLRWRQERSLAIELDGAIAIVNGKKVDGAVGAGLKQLVESWLSLQSGIHYP